MTTKWLTAHIDAIKKLPVDMRDAAISQAIAELEGVRPIEEIDPDNMISSMHFRPQHNRTLIFRADTSDTALIMIDFESGDVALAPHLTEQEAAKVFWEAVRHYDDGPK